MYGQNRGGDPMMMQKMQAQSLRQRPPMGGGAGMGGMGSMSMPLDPNGGMQFEMPTQPPMGGGAPVMPGPMQPTAQPLSGQSGAIPGPMPPAGGPSFYDPNGLRPQGTPLSRPPVPMRRPGGY